MKLGLDYDENSFQKEMNSIKQNNYLNFYDSSKLYFDITFFETENELEKISSELMLDYIKECTILYPQIFDIVYIMKRFLYNKKLNKSYQGGINSYSLFLLTLAFMKSYKNKYDIPIASLFTEYLYFYSNFNFFNSIIQAAFRNGFDNIVFHLVDLNINMDMNINNNIQEQPKNMLEKFFTLSHY